MTALARFRSPVGTLSIEATDDGVCSIRFGGRDGARPPISRKTRHNLEAALQSLADYFSGHPPLLPPLDLHGTEFQRIVWAALQEIPWGETVTYGELAGRLGGAGARAVGTANARNPVAILVPCHRVVASGGRLGGYAGGLEVKQWLLAHEAAHGPVLRPPRRA
ncbi:MAG TPA: methylated-DNA--[protein]-cysteine S-methyltransferase [Anaeromyxobacteraceae bacterium]|nr:methylated-DNA--[protein]-cysteine S-methyltransferase [Anaeromyxobacteraceae bacterium]